MKLKEHQSVKVKDNKGNVLNGTLLEIAEFPLDEAGYMWWVSVPMGENQDVRLYYEDDILRWNKDENECDCGAKITGSPGHSRWCSSNEL